jgi:hypothetical protein
MNKEFIPYEEALALKELGIDEPCFGHYQQEWHDDGMTQLEPSLQMIVSKQHQHAFQLCSAPIYSQVFKFFRDKYGIEGVTQRAEDFMWYKWTIYQYNENGKKYVFDWCEYKTYEEAELACLKKLIEIVKK